MIVGWDTADVIQPRSVINYLLKPAVELRHEALRHRPLVGVS